MKVHIEKEFLEAYDAVADALFRYCYFRTSDRDRAKDLVQQAFMKTWEYLSQGNTVDNLKAFLYRVARNAIIDQSRKKKETSLDLLMDEGFDVASAGWEKVLTTIEGQQMMQWVSQLDVSYREAILLRYIEDLTPKEIAAITGEHENTISVRIHRGMQKLRAILEENHHE
jgi:RNA polymerase sigma-70 factor (ECF subfamily)